MSNLIYQNIKSNQTIKFDANNCQEPDNLTSFVKYISVPERNFTSLVLQSAIVTDTQY